MTRAELFEENAAFLRELEARGSDLGLPRSIDFSLVFFDRTSADAFAKAAEQEGFRTEVEEVERDEHPWDVTASKEMRPSGEKITETEEWLDTLARSLGGRADGWGFFRI